MPKPDLRPGEAEIKTYRATGRREPAAVGGHRMLTNQRLCFHPHGVDRATGGPSWE